MGHDVESANSFSFCYKNGAVVANQTIYLVDPDVSSRELVSKVATTFDAGIQMFGSAEELLQCSSALGPGCLVLELLLPMGSSLELLRQLRRNSRSIPFVGLVSDVIGHVIVLAMQEGAVTVLEKPISERELWAAIRTALEQDQVSRRLNAYRDLAKRRLANLTDNERAVLELVLAGEPNKTIAQKLDVSVRTIESRRQQIFRKTETSSVAALVRTVMLAEPEAWQEFDEKPRRFPASPTAGRFSVPTGI